MCKECAAEAAALAKTDKALAAMLGVSRQLQEIARKIDDMVAEAAGERVAFSLFVWTQGRCSYISSGTDRREIIAVLEAMIAGWKGGMPDIPAHEVQG